MLQLSIKLWNSLILATLLISEYNRRVFEITTKKQDGFSFCCVEESLVGAKSQYIDYNSNLLASVFCLAKQYQNGLFGQTNSAMDFCSD